MHLMNEEKLKDSEFCFEIEYEISGFPQNLKRCFVMSGKMKKMYLKFSDIVIFDDAERTNKHGYLLVGF